MGHLRIRGRVDLLRALVASRGHDPDAVSDDGLEARLAHLLELYPRPEVVGKGVPSTKDDGLGRKNDDAGSGADDAVRTPDPVPVPKRRPPLQARFFAVLQTREVPAKDEGLQSSTFPQPQPLTLADCQPRDPGDPPPITPLVPRTRLWPALRRSLSHTREGRVDVPSLVRRISRAESVRRLPRAARRSAGGEVWIVFDVAHRLIPYEQDFVGIIKEVRRLQGVANVHLWVVSDAPDAVLSVQHGRREMEAVSGRIPTPPAGTPVLILGDLGLLARDGQAEDQWTAFCQRMTAVGARPVAWVPASPQLISRDAARHAQVHCLGAGDLRAVKPGRCAAKPARPSATLRRLLTFIACCVRVEPALLRSLRLMSADTAAEPGLEALVWSHPEEVRAGYRFCEIAGTAQTRYREAFGELGRTEGGCAEQDQILRRMLAWHAYQWRSTEALEVLIWQTHAARLPREFDAVVGQARDWLTRAGLDSDGLAADVAGYAKDLIARQGGDEPLMRAYTEHLAAMCALAQVEQIPPGLDVRDVTKALHAKSGANVLHPMELVTENNQPYLVPARLMKAARVRWFYESVGKRSDLTQVHWPTVEVPETCVWSAVGGRVRTLMRVSEERLALPLEASANNLPYTLNGGLRDHRIHGMLRPSWALEWGLDTNGLYALAPHPFGEPVKLRWADKDPADAEQNGPWSGRAFQAAGVSVGEGIYLGADLQFGLYLDIPFGSATQRFRWIEPGELVMGSPEGEAERFSHEGPQHVVRVTEGFWLAETACCQGVWESVMGSNPSEFKDDPQNPVEQVSWDDVQGFLREVEKRVPGVKADLPTEAEWEYACRGGSETAFSWGDGIDPSRANYDGTYSYADGPTGEYRAKTVPVKSFEPNAWGLYQMHGNVYEWCSDGMRTYDGASQVDPRGPIGDEPDAPRAVRGGSWDGHPRGLRAPYRSDWHRVWRLGDLGFRFSLRSTSGPEGSAERSPARRSAGAATMLDRLKAKLGFASKPDQSEEE
ncbi:formylglycine-generating enzyme family protein [Zoogloea sp.]|uniref:formylglycine-generating enzyme family protein n=1 Tax=Zoogloea sp. TaxID=49181 RepID=UPI0035B1A6CC